MSSPSLVKLVGPVIAAKLAEKNCKTKRDVLRSTRQDVLKIVKSIPRAVQIRIKYNTSRHVPLDDAKRIASNIKSSAVKKTGIRFMPVGSIRRESEFVRDIDILVIARSMRANILKNIKFENTNDIEFKESYLSGQRRMSTIIYDAQTRKYYKVDLFLALQSELPFALYHHTGSAKYNIRIRAHAAKLGLLLNQYGLYDRETRQSVNAKIKTERDLADYLGITYKQVTLR